MIYCAYARSDAPTHARLTLVLERATTKQRSRVPILEIGRCLRGRSIVRVQRVPEFAGTLSRWHSSHDVLITLLRGFASKRCLTASSAHNGLIERAHPGRARCPQVAAGGGHGPTGFGA